MIYKGVAGGGSPWRQCGTQAWYQETQRPEEKEQLADPEGKSYREWVAWRGAHPRQLHDPDSKDDSEDLIEFSPWPGALTDC